MGGRPEVFSKRGGVVICDRWIRELTLAKVLSFRIFRRDDGHLASRDDGFPQCDIDSCCGSS